MVWKIGDSCHIFVANCCIPACVEDLHDDTATVKTHFGPSVQRSVEELLDKPAPLGSDIWNVPLASHALRQLSSARVVDRVPEGVLAVLNCLFGSKAVQKATGVETVSAWLDAMTESERESFIRNCRSGGFLRAKLGRVVDALVSAGEFGETDSVLLQAVFGATRMTEVAAPKTLEPFGLTVDKDLRTLSRRCPKRQTPTCVPFDDLRQWNLIEAALKAKKQNRQLTKDEEYNSINAAGSQDAANVRSNVNKKLSDVGLVYRSRELSDVWDEF